MAEMRDAPFEVERLVFFSDAVFAIAITLMVVDLRVPEGVTSAGLNSALRDLTPQYVSFFLSFVVIGAFWLAHHRMFRYIERWDEGLLVLNLLFLLTIAFLPFPTSLIGRFEETRPAALIYSATILTCASLSSGLWWYASRRHRLVDPDLPGATIRLVQTRALMVAAIFGVAVVVAALAPASAQLVWWLAFPVHFIAARLVARRVGLDGITGGHGVVDRKSAVGRVAKRSR